MNIPVSVRLAGILCALEADAERLRRQALTVESDEARLNLEMDAAALEHYRQMVDDIQRQAEGEEAQEVTA